MVNYSTTVRQFDWPVLEVGNISFPKGEYLPRLSVSEEDKTVTVNHKITVAPFIENLVNNRTACCCCTVSIPKSGYRELFLGDGFSQIFSWDRDWAGEPPTFRPQIVTVAEFEHELQAEDGVHDMWVGHILKLPKGAKIAIGPDFRLTSSVESLLNIENDPSLQHGQIEIVPTTEGGFYFNVRVASNLYEFIRSPGGGNRVKHRTSILIHAVSSCLSILAKDYGNSTGDDEDNWQSYSNLVALADEMERLQIPTWFDSDFKPEKAATALEPHLIPDPEE